MKNRDDDAFDPLATASVLYEVMQEREAQVARYGQNRGLADGTGPGTTWLARLSPADAEAIETDLRSDYEDYEEEVGEVTWLHLVREEVAEAFKESDPVRLREELVQVAALCVSWCEKL